MSAAVSPTMMRQWERNGTPRSPAPSRARNDLQARYPNTFILIQRSNSHNQQLVVQKASKPTETVFKRARNEELLDWVDAHWFRRTFVSTYMAFVGQTANPWEVPARQSVVVMQKIWNASGGRDYEIKETTAVYQKVCGPLAPRMNNITVSFRRFNTLRTRGAMLSGPSPSQWS